MPTPYAAPSSSSPLAVDAIDLVKRYSGGKNALNHFNLQVEWGSFFALIGPNGAGKSTAFKILTTLSRLTSGVVSVAGFDVQTQPVAVRESIGYVAQSSSSDSGSSVAENLLLEGRLHGLHGGELKARVAELLSTFNLDRYKDQKVQTLSGGLTRRLDLAMAVIRQPCVLFLDEPTTGLDPDARVSLWRYLKELQIRDSLTIVISTHYLEEVDHLTSKLAFIKDGTILAHGSAAELKSRLDNDVLEVSFADEVEKSRIVTSAEKLSHCISDYSIENRLLRIRCERQAMSAQTVLQHFLHEQLQVTTVNIRKPSLEDVYFHFAGTLPRPKMSWQE